MAFSAPWFNSSYFRSELCQRSRWHWISWSRSPEVLWLDFKAIASGYSDLISSRILIRIPSEDWRIFATHGFWMIQIMHFWQFRILKFHEIFDQMEGIICNVFVTCFHEFQIYESKILSQNFSYFLLNDVEFFYWAKKCIYWLRDWKINFRIWNWSNHDMKN